VGGCIKRNCAEIENLCHIPEIYSIWLEIGLWAHGPMGTWPMGHEPMGIGDVQSVPLLLYKH